MPYQTLRAVVERLYLEFIMPTEDYLIDARLVTETPTQNLGDTNPPGTTRVTWVPDPIPAGPNWTGVRLGIQQVLQREGIDRPMAWGEWLFDVFRRSQQWMRPLIDEEQQWRPNPVVGPPPILQQRDPVNPNEHNIQLPPLTVAERAWALAELAARVQADANPPGPPDRRETPF